MAQQIINVGNVANDGQGDPLRDAFIKTNENFTELYNAGGITGIQNGNSNITIASNSSINMSTTGVANVFVVSETGTTTRGVIAGNAASLSGNITSNYFIGNGRFLTDVVGGAAASLLTGDTLSANVLYSTLNSVGALTSLTVAGSTALSGILNVTGAAGFGNSVTVAHDLSASGNITANNLISVNAVAFPSLSSSGNISAANVNIAGVYATALVSSAGNVAGVNILANNLISSGNLNISSAGNVSINPAGNVNLNNHWINNLLNPTQSQDAATKYYVDSVVSGLNIHPSANAGTTSDLAVYTGATVNYDNGAAGVGATLSIVGNSLSILDGVPLSANDRILIKNETNPIYNGIYVLNSSTLLTRATDFNSTQGASAGSYVFVSLGTQNGATSWTQIDTNPTIGTSNIVFTQFSGGVTSYGAGTGLNLNGTVFSIANTGVSAGSYGNASAATAFTVNNQGQITNASATTIVAPAVYLSGDTLSANVVNSSLTSVGTLTSLSVAGAVTAPSFTASGNVVAAGLNATSLSLSGSVVSPLRVTANITGGNLLTSGVISGGGGIVTPGNITGGNLSTGGNVTGGNITTGGSVLATALISSAGNVVAAANVSATYFLGNGALLSGLAASYSNANVASYLVTYGGNILVNAATATGNVSAANLVSTGSVSATGPVIGSSVSATGNVFAANIVTDSVIATSGIITTIGDIGAAGNVSGTYLLGNVSLASGLPEAYSNAKVVANVAALGSNPVSTTGNITAGYFIGNVALASGFPATYGNANVVANLAALGSNPISTSGSVTGGLFTGNGGGLGNIVGGNVNGTVPAAGTASYVTGSAQGNITSVGTLSSLTVSGSSQINSLGVGTAASGTAGEIRATDNITAFYSSDAKFKTNVRPIPNALATVEAIGGKLFDWTDEYIASRGGEDGYFITKGDFGVIAQDVLRVFALAVRERPDGSLAVDYDKLSALAFAAIIELSAEVRALKNK